MRLYDAMTPNSLRVNAFLIEKGIDVPREKVDVLGGGTRTPAFLKINSLGELPALELNDGRVLTESVAICRYLEERHPDPRLMGADAYEKAHVDMWTRRMEFHIFWPVGAFARHTFEFFADKVEQLPDYAETQMRLFDQNWMWLDKALSDGRSFVTGETFTVADITGMAALFVCNLLEKQLPAEATHANRWADAMRSRPSFANQFDKAA